MIFAPERMARIDVWTLCEDAERLASLLTREGSVHMVERRISTGEGEGFSPLERQNGREKIERLGRQAESMLHRLELTPLDLSMEQQEAFLESRTEEILAETEKTLAGLREAIDSHFKQRQESEAEITRLNDISEALHLLNDHGLSFLDLQGFEYLYARCGLIGRAHVGRLEEQLVEEPCALATRPALGNDAAFLMVGDREHSREFDRMLKDAGAHSPKPPERFVASFDEGSEQLEMELWLHRDLLADLTRAYDRSLKQWHQDLSECVARLHVHCVLDEALAQFGSNGLLTQISGFVPVSSKHSLLRSLTKDAEGFCHIQFTPVAEEATKDVPTRLRNFSLFRPFELFVRTYGLPGYNDVDPTPFVALSFLVMFGMMFGDVGHGLCLAGIGACLAFLPYKIFTDMRDLGRILTMAGLSGMVFGFLFGSFFGIEHDAFLPDLWMRPSHPENLTLFLGSALGLGVVVLSIGIVLNILQAIRQKNVRKALIGQWSAASLIFFWSLLVLFGMRMTGKEITAPAGLLVGLLATPLCLVAGGQIVFLLLDKRRASKAGGHVREEEEEEEIATILFEPIEIVMNLFSNSVSFLRVAAFGLAHAALTMAVFTINDMVDSRVATIISLPLEHLFIIVLEGMIVTIQCLRLEYYEFFSKFFVGNGVAYAPLSIRKKKEIE
jgi:V/A-type H+-transporting ATPase subunit I